MNIFSVLTEMSLWNTQGELTIPCSSEEEAKRIAIGAERVPSKWKGTYRKAEQFGRHEPETIPETWIVTLVRK